MRYVIGVDGGGTKTTAALVGEDSRVRARATAGASNYRSVGMDSASANITAAVTTALRDANMSADEIVGVCMCLAGFDTDLDVAVPRLASHALGFSGPVILENDVVGAWAGATGAAPGIVVISGTGATGLGMNARGEFWRTDGWDTLLGDDGSGYAIGREAIRAAIRMLDGRQQPTSLVRTLGKVYDVRDAEGMRRLVDGAPFGKFEVAAFALHVDEAAKAGDPVARGIIQQAGRDLGANVATIARILRMADEAFPISTVGSVIQSGPLIEEPFMAVVREAAPHATLRPALHPPEVGAAVLAFKRIAEDDLGSWTLGSGKRQIRRSLTIDEVARS